MTHHKSLQNVQEDINHALLSVDDEATRSFGPPEKPLIVMVSPPRSGSTLLHQMIISSFKISYISNIIARFWEAPYHGACLHQMIANPNFVSTCQSKYGHAVGPEEPHEWGWFWREQLKLKHDDFYVHDEKEINWTKLGQKLSAIQSLFGAPLIIDNVFAMNAIPYLKKYFKHVYPVFLNRDPFYVCNSVINMRLERLGDINSMKYHIPRNAEKLRKIENPIEQVVAQINLIYREIENLLKTFPDYEIFTVEYDDLKSAPQTTIQDFGSFANDSGWPLEKRPSQPIDPVPNRNQNKYVNPKYRSELEKYIDYYFH